MLKTPNLQLEIPEGGDATNNPYYFEKGYTKIDSSVAANTESIAALSNSGKVNYFLIHTLTGTTHTLTGTIPTTGIIQASFKATSDFTEGNTFSINATPYTAKPNGEELTLPDKAFITGDVVTVAVDVEGKKINFRVGGGNGFPKLWQQEVTAPAREDILKNDAVVYQKSGDLTGVIKEITTDGVKIEVDAELYSERFQISGNGKMDRLQ